MKEKIFLDMNYLNMQELKKFCNQYHIPYFIYVKTTNGTLKKTNVLERKGMILTKIKKFITTKKIPKPTVFPKNVVTEKELPKNLTAKDLVLYGQYKNGDEQILKLIKQLTDGQFKFGAIAQEVTRDFWSRGKEVNYEQFAKLWLKALAEHKKPNEEWAFLVDRHKGLDIKNWKELRNKKANEVMKVLNKILRVHSAT